MNQHDIIRESGFAFLRTAPPAFVAAISLNQWVVALTGVYVLLQIAFLIWRWRRLAKGHKLRLDLGE